MEECLDVVLAPVQEAWCLIFAPVVVLFSVVLGFADVSCGLVDFQGTAKLVKVTIDAKCMPK